MEQLMRCSLRRSSFIFRRLLETRPAFLRAPKIEFATVTLAAVGAVLFTGAAYGAASAEMPKFAFAANSIRLSGITPGGDAICFGRSVVHREGIPQLTGHLKRLTDTDRDGTVEWQIDVPAFSVWTVVDFSSGAFAVASPPGFELRLIDLPEVMWRGGTSYVDLSRDHLDYLLVRPRVGVWTLRAFEGGRLDADGRTDAKLRAQLAVMRAADGSPPAPPTATPRDVIVIIDPRALDVFARAAE